MLIILISIFIYLFSYINGQCSISGPAIAVNIKNNHHNAVNIEWVDHDCRQKFYNKLLPGESYLQETYINHVWKAIDVSSMKVIGLFTALNETMTSWIISSPSTYFAQPHSTISSKTVQSRLTKQPSSIAQFHSVDQSSSTVQSFSVNHLLPTAQPHPMISSSSSAATQPHPVDQFLPIIQSLSTIQIQSIQPELIIESISATQSELTIESVSATQSELIVESISAAESEQTSQQSAIEYEYPENTMTAIEISISQSPFQQLPSITTNIPNSASFNTFAFIVDFSSVTLLPKTTFTSQAKSNMVDSYSPNNINIFSATGAFLSQTRSNMTDSYSANNTNPFSTTASSIIPPKSETVSLPVIVGIVFGSVIGLVCIAGGIFFCYILKKPSWSISTSNKFYV